MSNNQAGLSHDTQALMAFDAGKKSTGVAYLLWFFTGGLGGHRFYLGRTGSAVFQLLLTVFGWIFLFAAGAGLLLLAPLGIWLLIAAFLIPGMAQDHNDRLMKRLNAGANTPLPSSSAVDELAKFAALRDQGALTEHEFEVQKARLLAAAPAMI